MATPTNHISDTEFIHQSLAEFESIIHDFATCEAALARVPASKGGRIFGVDIYREILPAYSRIVTGENPEERRKRRTILTEPTSPIAHKAVYRRLDKIMSNGDDLTVLSGGPGSGKTFASEALQGQLGNCCIYDTSLSSPSIWKELIEAKKNANDRGITVVYIHAQFYEAMERMVDRACRIGRYLTLKQMVQTHSRCRRYLLEFGYQMLTLENPSGGSSLFIHNNCVRKRRERHARQPVIDHESMASSSSQYQQTLHDLFGGEEITEDYAHDCYQTITQKRSDIPEDLHRRICGT